MTISIADVFIKDEDYAAVKFLTDKAKEWAFANKIPNSLANVETFCGKPTWKPQTRVGLYQCAFPSRAINKLIKNMKAAGLIVESEF